MRKIEKNEEAEAIRNKAAEILGWEREDVDTFSLRMLREMLQNKEHVDAVKVVKAIDEGLKPNNPHPLWMGR